MAAAALLVVATLGLAVPVAVPSARPRWATPEVVELEPMDPYRGASRDRRLPGKARRRARRGVR